MKISNFDYLKVVSFFDNKKDLETILCLFHQGFNPMLKEFLWQKLNPSLNQYLKTIITSF